MLGVAWLNGVVANTSGDIKSKEDYITLSNDEDEVAIYSKICENYSNIFL